MNQTRPRIVVVNMWHDDNKGDGGICEGVITLFKQSLPKAQLGVVSMLPTYAKAYHNSYRHLKQSFPDLEIAPSPFLANDPSHSPDSYRYLRRLWHLPGTLLRLLPMFAQTQSGLRLIANADLVISNGGQYIYTEPRYFDSMFRVFRNLYPLIAARIYGVPYILFSQSYDFIEGGDRLDNILVKSVFSKAKMVFARESISLDRLIKLGLSKSNLAVIPDAAFALQPKLSERVKRILAQHQLEPGKFWVITVRKWKTYTDSFLDEMAILIEQAIAKGIINRIVLVAHTQGPSPGENDCLATQKLASRIKSEAVSVNEDDLSPGELVAFYGQASLMIGTRFHSVIFALVGGTPAYAVSYAGPKTWGIMEMLGMKELCINMNDFSAAKVLADIQTVDLEAIAAQLPAKIGNLQQKLAENVNALIDDLNLDK